MMDAAPAPIFDAPHDTETDWGGLAPSELAIELAAAARDHFAHLFPVAALRAGLDGAPSDATSWDLVVEHGYSSVGLPEELGGIGDLADAVVVLAEAGRALVPVPLMSTVSAAQVLLGAGIEADELAERARSVAVLRPGATEVRILDGDRVTEAVVLEADGDGVRVRILRVPGADAPLDPIDPSRPLVTFPLDALEPLAEHRVPGAEVDDVLAPARIATAADLVGVASLALEGGIAHALVREQFGRLIGSFQAVKHELADADVAIERARSLTAGAAARLVADPRIGAATDLALLAQAAAADAALRATRLQVQLLGAMGLTFEADAPLALRRAEQTARHLGAAAELYAAAGARRIAQRAGAVGTAGTAGEGAR
jgi:alkylation response protein AidB-like acyl-CoA dehydrogenase